MIELAHQLGVRQISFLGIDVLTHVAFARRQEIKDNLALGPDDLPIFEQIVQGLTDGFAADFRSGFIAESPEKLLGISQYFAALNNMADFPAVRCNAPRFSAVFTADGNLQPCFFISPTENQQSLNGPELMALRHDIRTGKRTECKTCVCSMYRGVRSMSFANE
jgi:Fe-coproporphyrin III synthase